MRHIYYMPGQIHKTNLHYRNSFKILTAQIYLTYLLFINLYAKQLISKIFQAHNSTVTNKLNYSTQKLTVRLNI